MSATSDTSGREQLAEIVKRNGGHVVATTSRLMEWLAGRDAGRDRAIQAATFDRAADELESDRDCFDASEEWLDGCIAWLRRCAVAARAESLETS